MRHGDDEGDGCGKRKDEVCLAAALTSVELQS